MVKISDRMGELVGGLFRIKTKDDTEFELKPNEGHKRELLYNYKKVQEQAQRYEEASKNNKITNEFLEQHDDRSKKLHAEQNEIMKSILKTSYPDFKDEEVTAVMMRYDTELLSGCERRTIRVWAKSTPLCDPASPGERTRSL